jgi:uncharacterized protein (TIGR02265 family)
MSARDFAPPAILPDLPPGFVLPDWDAPLDLAAHLATIPAEATAKGMFVESALQNVCALGRTPPTQEKFHGFRDYPLRRVIELLAECARISHPEATLREALRRVARPGYAVFSNSLIGRVVFAAIGRDPAAIVGLSARAWKHAISVGRLEPRPADGKNIVLHFSDLYVTEPVAIAIAEGVLEACDRSGYVAQRLRSPTEGDLLIRWE